MKKTEYLELQEPLLLHILAPGSQRQDFHMLPAGTPLYEEYSFPEGHTQYRVYINIKADFSAKQVTSDKRNFTAPIWAEPVETEDLSRLMSSTPISKEDLVRILKARKTTRDELVQLLHEWQD